MVQTDSNQDALITLNGLADILSKYTNLSRKTYVSKLLINVLIDMSYITGIVPRMNNMKLNRMLIFSAHDTQVANMLVQITDTGYQVDSCPFASNLKLEIHKRGYNYSVRTLYNNSALMFNDCHGEHCPIDVFINRLANKVILNEQEVKKQCYTKVNDSNELINGKSNSWTYCPNPTNSNC